MVLRITVFNAGFLRKAIQAVPVAGSGMVLIIWCPDYFAVQSVFAGGKLPEGENPLTLLKISPEGFSSYDSTDGHFNAAIEASELEAVFHAAKDSEPIEFSQSVENNGLNELGYVNARFNRPVDLAAGSSSGAFMSDYIPMKIYGILPERVAKASDVSLDPSLIQLPPAATFVARHFAHYIGTLANLGMTATITVLDNEVFFTTEARPMDPLIMPKLAGLISTRKDCETTPVRFEIHMQNMNIQPGAALSDEVSLYKRTDTVYLFWFKLCQAMTFLKGDIIYYFY